MPEDQKPIVFPLTNVDPMLKSKRDGPPKGYKPPDAKPRVAPPTPSPQPAGQAEGQGSSKS